MSSKTEETDKLHEPDDQEKPSGRDMKKLCVKETLQKLFHEIKYA